MFIHIIDVFNNWANRHRHTAGAVIRWFSLSRRREGVTSSCEQSANDCLQLFDHNEHMRKPFWGGRRTASANYLSLCLQNVKDKTGETKHIQKKFFLILITMIYIHIIILFCLYILWIVFFFPYGRSSARTITNYLSSITIIIIIIIIL
jgi:hypothetical protein